MAIPNPQPPLWTAQQGHSPPTAAYLHIPFCRRRCYYCDFAVSVVGDTRRGETSGAIAQYVQQLCQEIVATPNLGHKTEAPLETIFFGGGTPSLLSVEQLQQILKTLDQQFGIATHAEISMEMDPGTFERSHLQGYLAGGVNRVSLGVQAFQTEILAACGRTHTSEDIEIAVKMLRQEGLENFSLDLISGLPHQTLTHWQESLERAIALNPNHLSIYDLTVEPITAFGRWYQPGAAPLPSDEATAEMYRIAQSHLTAAGYQHYEISNYAKPGYQCCHNRVYWENQPYYGFGMGAASYTQGQRFTRPRKREEYYTWIQAFQQNGGILDCPNTSPTECLLDTLMVGLRLAEGVKLEKIQGILHQINQDALASPTHKAAEVTLQTLVDCLQPYLQRQWVELTGSPPQGSIRLSDPEGFLFSNVVLTALFEQFLADDPAAA